MSKLLLAALALFSLYCLAGTSAAEELIIVTPQTHEARDDRLFQCQFAGKIRSVSLQYAKQPPLPCEVLYHRAKEGHVLEVLWEAQYDPGFCEKKLEGLIEELVLAGWSCLEI